MKTTFSNPDYLKKAVLLHQQVLQVNPPAILFDKKKKAKEDGESKRDDSDHYKKIPVPIDPTKPEGQTAEWKVRIFEHGDAEDWIKWRMRFEELALALPLDSAAKKVKYTHALLKGDALNRFLTAYNAEKGEDEERYERAIEEAGIQYFRGDRNAWRRQRSYMRYHLHFGKHTVSSFKMRLLELNKYLQYFPRPNMRTDPETLVSESEEAAPAAPAQGTGGKQQKKKKKVRKSLPRSLPEDELVEIMDRAKPIEWQRELLTADYDPYDHGLEEFCQYLEKLEARARIDRALKGESLKDDDERGDRKKGKKRKGSGGKSDGKSKCGTCGKSGHDTKDCWSDPKNADKRPNKRRKEGDKKDKKMFTAEQFQFLVSQLPSFQQGKNDGKKRDKRKVRDDSDASNEENQFFERIKNSMRNSSSDSDSDYPMEYLLNVENRHKRRKTHHASTEVVGEVVSKKAKRPMRVLLDTGTTATIVLREFVDSIALSKYKQPTKTKWQTMGGSFVTRRKALLHFKLPEFSNSKVVQWICHVDDTHKPEECRYDMIIGTDLMEAMGVDILFSRKKVIWDGVSLPMRDRGTVCDREAAELIFHTAVQSPLLDTAEKRQRRILDADYSAIDIDEFVKTLKLRDSVKNKLARTLKKYPRLFKGGLGTLNIEPIHLEIREGAKPYHAKAFPIPKAYEQTTKKECRRFEEIGVWEQVYDSEWAASTFIQPKKTGDVRVLTDFRELNKWLVRKPYPLPKVADLIQKLERFKYATALDLSMGYYHIPLDEESQKLCTTILPWGKYKYKRLPMGISCAPDIFQSIMNRLLGDLDYVLVYLDDILILSGDKDTDDDHLNKISVVLERLEQAGFAANLRKSFFMQSTIEYLGYDLTPAGIAPQPKKVEAIQRMLPPINKRQLRRFLGMVNYYRDMWKRRSHIIAPLTEIASPKATWRWGSKEQKAFEDVKNMVSQETMLAYPDFTKVFHVYSDASDYQLGGVIMQDDKPLAFYTRKLNGAQSRYTVGEKELLGIVETLKEFENILLGQRLVVHTDHLNLLYNKVQSQRIQRWRVLLEEYGPEVRHIKGERNVVADTLSRHPMSHRDRDLDRDATDDPTPLSYKSLIRDISEEEFPLLPALIAKKQSRDTKLKTLLKKDKTSYKTA